MVVVNQFRNHFSVLKGDLILRMYQ